ncbi:MAG TPA: ATP-binding protein [Elusimicrobiota bacterium]|nr:ATP-binding protein [Elusimicrobiota bacterium]
MRAPNLRSQLVVVAGLFLVYSAGVGVSSWIESRAHARLEAQFHESLTVLSSLPNLRDGLHRVDQNTDQYLLTGQRSWLDRRDEALDQVRAIERELTAVLTEPGERVGVDEMDRRLTSYLAESGQWIARRRAGRLTPAEAARAGRVGRGLETTAAPLTALGESHVAQLRARREELQRTSRITVLLILLAGGAAAGFVALFLSSYLTGPVSALRVHARRWKLGGEWAFSPPRASPEVADLADAMREMAERLNKQYAREAELGRLKGSLVSMTSHEFNNALSVLAGMANLLRATEPAPPTGRRAEYYTVLDANLRALSLAVSNLLDMGRLEDGRFAVHPRRAELRRVLEDAATALKPLYERKNLAFSLDLPPDLPPALADPEALVLVATNLLGNAIKYTPENGKVAAGVAVEKDGRLRVYVSDSGIGVAPEDRARILEGHRTPEGQKAAKGFGVGLTIVKRVLDAHGAALEIDGAKGQGSRFSFVLPRWIAPVDGGLFA